jgi:hypothetical protein
MYLPIQLPLRPACLHDLWLGFMYPFQRTRCRFNRAMITPRVLVVTDLIHFPQRPPVIKFAKMGGQPPNSHRYLSYGSSLAPPQALDQQPVQRISQGAVTGGARKHPAVDRTTLVFHPLQSLSPKLENNHGCAVKTEDLGVLVSLSAPGWCKQRCVIH